MSANTIAIAPQKNCFIVGDLSPILINLESFSQHVHLIMQVVLLIPDFVESSFTIVVCVQEFMLEAFASSPKVVLGSCHQELFQAD